MLKYSQIAIGWIACIAISSTIAGSFVAWKLGYHQSLGQPLAHYMSFGIYAPWAILTWAKWEAQVPVIRSGLIIAFAAALLPLIGIIAKHAKSNGFGRNEWGTLSDAKKAGLLSSGDGIIIGRMCGKILRFCDDKHTMWAGASGSGKTAQLVSTLLSIRDRSVLVLDPKGQLYKMTSGFRSTIGAAFFFDPTEMTSARYNPLCEIPVGTVRELGGVQNIAEILIDSSGLKNSEPFWPITASELLTAVILFAINMFPDDRKNLHCIRLRMFNLTPMLELMSQCDILECKMVAIKALDMGDRQRDGIVATAQAALNVFADPVVATITQSSDFRISDLVCGPYPMSLYLQVPVSDRARMMPLFRLMLVQIFKTFLFNVYEMPDGRKKLRRMQFVAEEFPGAGKIPDFAQDIQEMREYGISCMLMCQSLQNLADVYGNSQAIRENCHIVTCFASSDLRSMQDISTSIGSGIDVETSTSKPGPKMFQNSKTTSKRRRPLLEPAAVRMLDMKKAILLVTGCRPLRVSKVFWFKTSPFKRLGVNLKKHPDTPLVQNAEILALHETAAKGSRQNPTEEIAPVPAIEQETPVISFSSELENLA